MFGHCGRKLVLDKNTFNVILGLIRIIQIEIGHHQRLSNIREDKIDWAVSSEKGTISLTLGLKILCA